jgi:uncharacterized protein involved in propanediol utilization
VKIDGRVESDAHADSITREGLARTIGHHGELLQGSFRLGGRLRRALITLPCDQLIAIARVAINIDPTVEERHIVVDPPWKTKAQKAAEIAIGRYAGDRGVSARLTIDTAIPVRRGFGSSSADVIATILAVADAFRVTLSRTEVARMAVAAEGPSDPLMFGQEIVLYAQREGCVLERFWCSLPPLDVVGLCFDLSSDGVDTVAFPPAEYSAAEVAAFDRLLGAARQGLRRRDAQLLGLVATQSAWINQMHLPKDGFLEVLSVARATGAVGIQVAHSGDVMGILFDPTDPASARRIGAAVHAVQSLGVASVWRWRVRPRLPQAPSTGPASMPGDVPPEQESAGVSQGVAEQ